MPVGKVFDASNQILFSPVSNYYQGEAIRAGLAAQKQDAELKDLQIESVKDELANAPSAREQAKKLAELQIDNVQSQINERIRNGEVEELELNAKLLTPVLTDYANEPDEDKALARFNESIRAVIPSMSEASQQAFAEAAGPDHVFDHNEVMLTGLGVRSFLDSTNDSPFSKINPKDYTPESIAEFQKTGDMASLRAKEDNGAGRQRDDEIAAATEMLRKAGIPNAEEEATKVVDGIVTYTPDPSGGSIYRIDKLKGTAEEINIESGVDRGARPEVPPEGTLWNLAKDATGPIPTMTAGASKASGAAGGPISEKVVSARQKFKAAENDVIRAFSLNPRYPVAEQNRIKENIAITPTFFDSEGLMQARMTSIDAFLKEKLALLEWEIKRPGIDKKQRAEDEKTIAGIRGFLDTLGAPKSGSVPQVKNDEDYNALPSGTVFIDPDGVKRTKP